MFDFGLVISHAVGVEVKVEKVKKGERAVQLGVVVDGDQSQTKLPLECETRKDLKTAGIHELTGC